MSRRLLNKRQLREKEELEALQAIEQSAAQEEHAPPAADEDSDEDEQASTPANPFAALGGQEENDESESEVEDAPAATKKKNKKKKKPKKKNTESAVSTPVGKKGKKGGSRTETPVDDGMDEVDRALAELKLRYGDTPAPQSGPAETEASGSHSNLAFRNLLSVDPKNLDSDAELRRFFGSKVIASAAPSTPNRHRAGPSSKIRYTLAKPKPQYPPPTSLAGLNMRELDEYAVEDLYERRGWEQTDPGEKWYTFEHSPAWREIERQFLGAVRSHDPNELMALLSVYPWHVDTLLQMSEVYRLQSDIGAASDYAERALYAFDRCLAPGFNVTSGACRLDFDYVENRPLFTGLHRIIFYLGRRGVWVTAFNFAKLLFSLDPEGDPHAISLWLDFLAVKAGQGQWLLQMLEMRETSRAAALWYGYPGMAYARALALRQEEDSRKDKEHEASTAALVTAFKTFPEVIVLLGDKIGASVPPAARTSPLTAIEAGYTNSPTTVLHLLAHIYVSRSEALWKEPSVMSWFEKTLASSFDSLDDGAARAARAEAHAIAQTPRDLGADGELVVPLNICRHVLCSESTSWLGFLPPTIRNRPFHAYDPLPPGTALTAYNAEYFEHAARVRGAAANVVERFDPRYLDRFLEEIRGLEGREPDQWDERMREVFAHIAGRPADQMTREERAPYAQELVRMWEGIVRAHRAGLVDMADYGQNDMPGQFPG